MHSHVTLQNFMKQNHVKKNLPSAQTEGTEHLGHSFKRSEGSFSLSTGVASIGLSPCLVILETDLSGYNQWAPLPWSNAV